VGVEEVFGPYAAVIIFLLLHDAVSPNTSLRRYGDGFVHIKDVNFIIPDDWYICPIAS
jgi:hypothetical protein